MLLIQQGVYQELLVFARTCHCFLAIKHENDLAYKCQNLFCKKFKGSFAKSKLVTQQIRL